MSDTSEMSTPQKENEQSRRRKQVSTILGKRRTGQVNYNETSSDEDVPVQVSRSHISKNKRKHQIDSEQPSTSGRRKPVYPLLGRPRNGQEVYYDETSSDDDAPIVVYRPYMTKYMSKPRKMNCTCRVHFVDDPTEDHGMDDDYIPFKEDDFVVPEGCTPYRDFNAVTGHHIRGYFVPKAEPDVPLHLDESSASESDDSGVRSS